ncbi:hypothetical protein FT663_03465 [Candidozyma haemuli var. vulneris]|uniref:Thiol-specific monooxygenase n=1 Tax=Candidozyma haemuli TaxID=45357 RepID=A0A2V1AW55_9ASCO|nr:hypothetical protein CXQ85_000534 [[Candida] haemuloni]KAF3988259.1 hypothetical protein FT662_03530 [[Candida] haemuloni var. vulneris]KAF3989804.1 hypothetical protein FT663_03465 [[Candida] haemuloni var. vulneris]PVH21553.1 hypothetical protein CXQ85_000534 [[Candida] haemuloni]
MPSTVVPDFLKDLNTPVAIPEGQIKRIAIIGGGASGAIALDTLVKEKKFDEIVLFERRDTYGGIWVLDQSPKAAHELIKAGASTADLDPPLENPFNGDLSGASKIRRFQEHQERFVHTPCYNGMLTNIIENMMTYSDEKAWLPGSKNKYVDRGDVRNYIDRYIGRHKNESSVRLVPNTAVEDVQRNVVTDKEIPYDFTLTLRHQLQDSTEEWYQEKFDAVVVATGHYHVPFIPATPGLAEVQEKWPSVVQHAKYYRNSAPYKDKTVVVIGARASGADLTKYAADTATKVYQSIREVTSQQRKSRRENVEIKPGIKGIEVKEDGFSVVFSDGSVVSNPDHIIYATGYQFSFPFLRREYGDIARNGVILPSLYQHTFFINEPLLVILGVPTDAISFRAFEYQAVLAGRYLASRVSLPNRSEQLQWAENRLQEKGERRAYHTIGATDALEYMRTLTELGTLKGSDPVGREFPEVTEEDVKEYAESGAKLREAWDMPRVAS